MSDDAISIRDRIIAHLRSQGFQVQPGSATQMFVEPIAVEFDKISHSLSQLENDTQLRMVALAEALADGIQSPAVAEWCRSIDSKIFEEES